MTRLGSTILSAAALFCAVAAAHAAEPPDPSVRLYDTGATGRRVVSARDLHDRKGWTPIPEGDAGHAFTGAAVMMNDRIAVILPGAGCVAEVRTTGAHAGRMRPVALSLGGSDADAAVSLRIVENGSGAVELEAVSGAKDGTTASCRLRLTAGEPVVECRAGRGAGSVRVAGAARRVLVPDFFGDDWVLGPADSPAGRTGLPAENVLLWPDPSGNAVVLFLWDRTATYAERVRPQQKAGTGHCLEVGCVEGTRFWVACLDGPGLWHELAVAETARPASVLGDFRLPFPAKWRASFVGHDGACRSVTFEASPNEAPVPEGWRGPVILYPIDRSRATPLTTILPMDVLRSTLGVGPCQYILALEGLGSEAPATPDAVTKWVERLFKKKRAARSRDEIRERLGAMLGHLAATRKRIDDYAAFGRQVRGACASAAKQDAADARAVLAICDRLEEDLARGRAAMKTPEAAAGLGREVDALVGKENVLADCERIGGRLRAIGHAHDATLARSRMAVRRIKAWCRTQEGGLARKVERMADARLRSRPGLDARPD